METYFRSTDDSHGGMICEGEEGMEGVFDKMKEIHQESFAELGGEYSRRGNEKTCAIRLPSNRFFEVRVNNKFADSAGEVDIVQGRRLQHYFAYGDIFGGVLIFPQNIICVMCAGLSTSAPTFQ